MLDVPKSTNLLEEFKTKEKIENFESVVENSGFWDRHLFICEIDSELGDAIENMIRFWNRILSVYLSFPVVRSFFSPVNSPHTENLIS